MSATIQAQKAGVAKAGVAKPAGAKGKPQAERPQVAKSRVAKSSVTKTGVVKSRVAKSSITKSSATLLMGDATKRDVLPEDSVDLVVTSPPYNIGKEYSGSEEGDKLSYQQYAEFSAQWLENCYFWTRPTGRICVNVSLDKNKNGKHPLSADLTRWAMDAGWKYHATIVWNEGNISRRTAWGSWKSASAPHVIAPVEVVIVLYKDEWKRAHPGENDITADEFKDWVLGIWTFNGENGKRIGHEAPFPRELPRRCMKLFSFVGDTVLDPFLGSGTTMIEALESGRNSIGIELEKKYCDLSRERILKECGAKLVKSPQAKADKSTMSCWTL